MKTKKRTACLERDQVQAFPDGAAAREEVQARRGACRSEGVLQLDEGLCCIGLMHVAQEWSEPRAPGLSAIIHGVAERMGLPPDLFELFVAEQLGALLTETD